MIRIFFFFKQKTAYEMRISDWSSDVCSSDLLEPLVRALAATQLPPGAPQRLVRHLELRSAFRAGNPHPPPRGPIRGRSIARMPAPATAPSDDRRRHWLPVASLSFATWFVQDPPEPRTGNAAVAHAWRKVQGREGAARLLRGARRQVVRFENVFMRYDGGPVILRDVSFELEPGSFHFLTGRSEEHTSELQSLMRISSAVFSLKKKK